MKHFHAKSLLAVLAFGTALFFQACQKEQLNLQQPNVATNPVAADRSPEHYTYAVTVFDGVNNCLILEIEEATGLVTNQFNATVDPGFGTGTGPVVLADLKGIARTSWGQFFITTGPGCFPDIYDNALLKVNVNLPGLPLGTCSFFNSISPFGAVSDLEFDPVSGHFFGLANNSNTLVEIADINNNFTTYTSAPITGINARQLKGLALVRDNTGQYLVGAANRTGAPLVSTDLYSIPFTGGAVTFMTSLAPGGDFNAGHCGIGFDLDLNHLAINRRGPLGLSEINPWNPPFGGVTGTNFWGADGFDIEDLTSSVY